MRLNQSGHKAVTRCLVLLAMPSPEATISSPSQVPTIRLGFTATKKLGNAVVRNRIKRRLRAASAELLPKYAVAGHDLVIIGRHAALTEEYDGLLRDLRYAVKRVNAELTKDIPQCA